MITAPKTICLHVSRVRCWLFGEEEEEERMRWVAGGKCGEVDFGWMR